MAKAQVFQIRLTEAEEQGFQASADLAGNLIPAWVTERFRLASIRGLRGGGQRISFIATAYLNELYA